MYRNGRSGWTKCPLDFGRSGFCARTSGADVEKRDVAHGELLFVDRESHPAGEKRCLSNEKGGLSNQKRRLSVTSRPVPS